MFNIFMYPAVSASISTLIYFDKCEGFVWVKTQKGGFLNAKAFVLCDAELDYAQQMAEFLRKIILNDN